MPKLDREVAEAAGKSIGLEPIMPVKPKQDEDSEEKKQPLKQTKVTDLYRSVSQDDMMGYDDDEY